MRPDDAAVVGRENAGLKRTVKEEGIKCKTVAGEIAEIKLQTRFTSDCIEKSVSTAPPTPVST